MVRENYSRLATEQQNALRTQLRSLGVDQLEVDTEREYQQALAVFFRRRERLRK